MSRYDAVVIGAGNGGLTASLGLARKGLKVLLLERHNIPGGAATSFRRGRFEFEVALHQLSGMGTMAKPGPLRLMLDGLEVTSGLEFVEMDDLYRVAVPGGIDVTLPADRHGAVAELQRRFPKEKANIERFFDLVYTHAEQFLSAFYFKDPEASKEKYSVLYKYAFRPAKDVMDELFNDDLLKAILSVYWGYLGMPPPRLAFAYLALLFYVYLEFKPFHIKGGSQALSNALLNKFLSLGGEARFNCGAAGIETAGASVRSVTTDDGDRVETRYVVSNVSPIVTYLQLMDPLNVPEKSLVEMRGRNLSASAFVVFMGLDCEPADVGVAATTSFFMNHPDISDRPYSMMKELETGEELMVMSCYDVADPDFSPPGACQMNLVTLKFGEPWMRVPPTEYYRTKYRCADAMLKTVERVHPNIRTYMEEVEVATPLTHMRYLGHPNGAIYGFEQQTKDSMFFQPGIYSPIEGLYFASGWSGDCGFQPTLEAGHAAAKAVIKSMGG